MKHIIRTFILIALTSAIGGCHSGQKGQDENSQVTTTELPDTLTFESFAQSFDTIALPYSLPLATADNKDSIAHDLISQYFDGKRFAPAYGTERDLPDLATNGEDAMYYKVGAFHSSGFTALIIRKQIGQDNYYYLSTFSNGTFTDGLCIAFTEGDKNDRTERRAAINDDYSIQIMQSNILNGQITDDTDTRIFVMSADGKINSLSAGQEGS